MKNSILLFLLFCFGGNHQTGAQVPTYHNDIAPILSNKCATCHANNKYSNIQLASYKEVAQNSKLILYVLDKGLMPKWKADTIFCHFSNERKITTQESNQIRQWISTGLKEGKHVRVIDKKKKLDKLKTVWKYYQPKIEIDLHNKLKDSLIYIYIPFKESNSFFVNGYSFLPGNSNVIHHANCWIYQTQNDTDSTIFYKKINAYTDGIVREKDAYPEDIIFGCPWVPGSSEINFPVNSGFKMPQSGYIIFEIHVSPNAGFNTIQPKLALQITEKQPDREVKHFVLGTNFNGTYSAPLIVNPNSYNEITITDTLPDDVSIFAIGPHMHYIGRKFEAFAISPTHDTIPIVKINDWDFNWQEYYVPQKLLVLHAGTSIVVKVFFDNTSNNPYNPFHPPQTIIEGIKTTNEMINLDLLLLFYKAGDENITQ